MNPSRLSSIVLTGECSAEEASEMASILMQAKVRSGGSATSQAAASSASIAMTPKRLAVLNAFKRWGPMTDEQLRTRYAMRADVPGQSESGLRTRRSELVRMQQLRDSGTTRKMSTGRQATVWELVL